MIPSGRQCASGLSLLLLSTRWRCSSAAQGVKGRAAGRAAHRFDVWLSRIASGVRGDVVTSRESPAFTGGCGPRTYCEAPEKSGLPSAVLGVGPFRSALPSGVLG